MHEISVAVVHQADEPVVAQALGLRPALHKRGEWSVVPLNDVEVPDLEEPDAPSLLSKALSPLVERLRGVSLTQAVGLVFTQYWGGWGHQAAACATPQGLEGPRVERNAINSMLERIGVQAGAHRDAFEAMGLHEIRSVRWNDRAAQQRVSGLPSQGNIEGL
jgi:hypothetical protein